MINILYTIIIFPIEQIIEISFVLVERIFRNNVLAIFGVSVIVTVLTLPLYAIAEKLQRIERETRIKLKPTVDLIKEAFKGDKQYMILSVYYRQNNYHPVYALRSSLGIIIQIPFFLAAFNYISSLEYIRGTSFFFINDLGTPDNFMSLGIFTVNLLPFLMLFINCVSAYVYTRGFLFKEKIQVYLLGLLFFIILYNSPSALLLYWIMNNFLSLIRNILMESRHKLKIIYLISCLGVVFIFIRLIPAGFETRRFFIIELSSTVFFIPLLIKLFLKFKKYILARVQIEKTAAFENKTFILSSLILFLLCGFVIPASLIASSIQEFSFPALNTSPLFFLWIICLQCFGIFSFWPLCIFFLFPKRIKTALTLFLSVLCLLALVNTFIFSGYYGFLTSTFQFSSPVTISSHFNLIILSSISILFFISLTGFLLLTRYKIILNSLQFIILITLFTMGLFNIANINREYRSFQNLLSSSGNEYYSDQIEPVFQVDRYGNNVVLILLDAAISGYIPYIFEENPAFHNYFSGFTYYPNTIGGGTHTRIGVPFAYGGYEYAPELIQINYSYAMQRHNEAVLLLPKLFSSASFNVTVADPPFVNYSWSPDLSIFAPYPEINALSIAGNHSGIYLRSNPDLDLVSIPELIEDLLIRFTFFKIAPPPFRVFIYDSGKWLKPGILTGNNITLATIDNFSSLYYLPQLTEISDNTQNIFLSIYNSLPHDPGGFQFPDYYPVSFNTFIPDLPFAGDISYQTNIAALLQLGKWFTFLQQEGIYDNTRIIIVSDHGSWPNTPISEDITLPDGIPLSTIRSFLMIKDFNTRGSLNTDNTFMTIADVPLLALHGIIENPVNPFTGNELQSNKENGIFVTTSGHLSYTISDNQWLHVHSNIFDLANWSRTNLTMER